ncbi:hypothetical protein NPIL_456671 [Nephila pilipes]|uniref:Uncharacterized protein n=1 Tax=Nephila pilipes TaxID=299642 RepID=A0A8X6U0T2_NEPPI|nr:hypothetical protein NPIL_456671 [Nephila pilipes]
MTSNMDTSEALSATNTPPITCLPPTTNSVEGKAQGEPTMNPATNALPATAAILDRILEAAEKKAEKRAKKAAKQNVSRSPAKTPEVGVASEKVPAQGGASQAKKRSADADGSRTKQVNYSAIPVQSTKMSEENVNRPMPSPSSEETSPGPSIPSQETGTQHKVAKSRLSLTLPATVEATPTALIARDTAVIPSDPDNIFTLATGEGLAQLRNEELAPPDDPAGEPGAEGDNAPEPPDNAPQLPGNGNL